MTANELLTYLVQALCVLIAVQTIRDFIRMPDRVRLEVALLFGDLGLIVITQWLTQALDLEAKWVGILSSLMNVSLPYLSLRVVQALRPVSRAASWVALAGMLGSGAVVVFAPTPAPVFLVIPVVAYFVGIEGYVAVVLIRGALTTTGLIHVRLLLAGLGSVFLAGVIVFAAAGALLPAAGVVFSPLSQACALAMVVCYFLGFAPPNRLRRAWQLEELYAFIADPVDKASREALSTALDRLCRASERAAGGVAAAVALAEGESKRLVVRASAAPALVPVGMVPDEALVGVARNSGRAQLVRLRPQRGAREPSPLAGCEALLAVPIATSRQTWGVLLVWVWRVPLFAADCLALLTTLCEQTAIGLGYVDLVVELEQRVAERTSELAQAVREMQAENTARKQAEAVVQRLNEDLRRHAFDLEASNKELEGFAYSVSHDLRAPLRGIDGFSLALLEDYGEKLDETGQGYLQMVRQNAQRMGHLIDDLLAFSRLGRQELRTQPVQLSDVAWRAWEELRPEWADRQVELRVSEMPPCQADPALLQQVYLNLLGNALKFSRTRTPAIIEAGCEAHGGDVVYYVRDNGVGFDMQYVDKLFGVFQRLHRAEDFEGTGVGLALVQRIIHRHGGRVRAEGEVGRGATFYFTVGGGDGEHGG